MLHKLLYILTVVFFLYTIYEYRKCKKLCEIPTRFVEPSFEEQINLAELYLRE